MSRGYWKGRSVDRHPPLKPAAARASRTPILAAYIDGPMKIQARLKGETLHATVRRDGTIRLNGKVYTSPSLAGAAARNYPTCNGWIFWQYERTPGDWVPLNELRK